LLGVVLVAMTLNLLVVYALMERESQLRDAFADLNEERLGVSQVLFAISDRADQLQRLARLASSSGEVNFVQQHASLRHTLQLFREQLSTELSSQAALPDLRNLDLRDWLAALEQASLSEPEQSRLRGLLNEVLAWSREQELAIRDLIPGEPDATVLMHLSSPEQELANWRSSALVEELEFAVADRLDSEGGRLQASMAQMQHWQSIALACFAVLIFVGVAAFQRLAVRPLKEVLRVGTLIGGGDYHRRVPLSGVREIRDLGVTLNWMADAFEGDIRARLQAEERARLAEARVRAVGDLAPGAIWATRYTPEDGLEVVHTSRGFNKLYALGGDAIAKDLENLFRCIHPMDRQATRDFMRPLRDRKTRDLSLEHRTLRPDGEYRWTRVIARITYGDAGSVSWNGFCMDIHELKLLRESTEAALDSARSASASKSAFLANISHEVRTPLNAIIGIADLALSEEHPPALLRKFQRIGDAGRNLLHLLNDVLDTSKLEAGRVELHREDFRLDTLLDRLQDLHGDTASGRGLQMRTRIHASAPTAVRGDPLRLQQALSNLLGNALKFTESGVVELLVLPPPGRSTGEQIWLDFVVRDTGPGIPAELLPKLFDPFTQADEGIGRPHGGTGLGLTIVRQIAELMGGEVRVQSTLGQGSSFSLHLPFERAQAAPEAPTPLPSTEQKSPGSDARLSADQCIQLSRLVHSGDAAARDQLRSWFGDPLPESLSALQAELDAFDFERA
ncbi:MAG: ATP-binding protein, partial [Oceanococcaceae bacterium]